MNADYRDDDSDEQLERHELQNPNSPSLMSPPRLQSPAAAMEVFRDLPGSAELSAFCKLDESKREFTDELRRILEVSAMTGLYWHRWDELRTLLLFRLKQVLQDFYKSHMDVAVGPPRPLVTGESYQELEDRLTSGLESFTDGPPFTLQRLCEVLLNPRDRYPNLDKVALAFEKLLLVTSTISPSPGPYPGVPSAPAPVPAPAKDADQKLPASAKAENVDSTREVMSESNDVSVQAEPALLVANREEPTVLVVANREEPTVSVVSNREEPTVSVVSNREEPTVLVVANREEPTVSVVSNREEPTVSVVSNREEPTVSVVADEEMADVEGTESKDQTMEVDVPQPSETIPAGDVLRENTDEVAASKEEQQPVDETNSLIAPLPETSAPMEDDNETNPDVMESNTEGAQFVAH